MLSLEIIIGLGLLYCFFMYGLLRAARARRAVRREVPKRAPRRYTANVPNGRATYEVMGSLLMEAKSHPSVQLR